MEIYLFIIQMIFTIGTGYGVYKTKIELLEKRKDQSNKETDLLERVIRLEEKMNFLINTTIKK